MTLIYPVITIQLLQLYPGISLTTLGAMGTVHYLLYGIGAFPAGWLTDRFGSRKVLLIYFLGSAAAVMVLVTAGGLPQLTVGLALLGLICGLYHPAGMTMISHNASRISRQLGVHGVAGSLGLALGPLVGGFLAHWQGWQAPYLFFGGLALAAGIYLALTPTGDTGPDLAPHPQAGRRNRPKALVYVYITGVFMGLVHRGVLSFMPLHLSQLFPSRLAPILVGGGLTAIVLASGIVGQLLGGQWGERFPRVKSIGVIIALNIPFLVLMSYSGGLLLLALALGWGIMSFSYQPVSNALIADFSSPERRGTLFGIFHGLAFGVGALASTLAGAIGDAWGTAAIFSAMGILLAPAVLAGMILPRLKAINS